MAVARTPMNAAPPPLADAPAVQVEICGLGLRRGGKWLFRGLDLELPRGRFIAVTGPSGAGKSSFLGCLGGTLGPTEGQIRFACARGCRHAVGEFQSRVGRVFQNLMLAENSTLLTNVLCGRLGRHAWWRTLFGFPEPDRRAAHALLADLGLGAYLHRRAADVSGGEQQRAAVARALLQEPEVLLADEPVSSLDGALAGTVLERLWQGTRERGCTVVCVLHDERWVDRFADCVLRFDRAPGDGTGTPRWETVTAGREG